MRNVDFTAIVLAAAQATPSPNAAVLASLARSLQRPRPLETLALMVSGGGGNGSLGEQGSGCGPIATARQQSTEAHLLRHKLP